MGKRKPRFDWGQITKEFAEWVSRKQEFLWNITRSEMERHFHESKKKRCAYMASDMRQLAAWLGGNGLLGVLKNEGRGWEDIQGSLQYWYWSVRILIQFANRDKKPRASATNCALILAHAIATHQDEIAEWCGERFTESLEDKSIFKEWDLNPFGPFMTWLYAIWKGIDLRLDASFGVYQQIVESWDEPDRIGDALLAACDYHCQRIDGEEIGLEFQYNPYGEFPAEILAIRRVRHDLGLETPEISHVLLDSPLAHPPEEIPDYEDELLERVIELAKQDLAGL